MKGHDIFLVFVEGSEGNEAAYAEWFSGQHMADMDALPGVVSATAYQLETLDDMDVPAQLCAIYETTDGPGILATIARAKGTDALPTSDIQGKMIWRVLEACERRDFGEAPETACELICMFGGDLGDAASSHLFEWICANSHGIAAVRQMRLSPVQPARGSEYSSVLFATMARDSDAAQLATTIAARHAAAQSRYLLAVPRG